ncbi:MFS transporter, partial [Streptomyces sp. t39]|uniref:MFS transporter n=1 Tax=Streptomyces sp. t39 TaxID=1828156 RepID=UPI0011CE34F0
MYGATFATVLGALTLMSVADGGRPRRTLVVLQCAALAGVAAQALPGLPLAARFGLLLVLGFFQSLGTGTRMGLLAEVVPRAGYAPARSLMNITAGTTAVLGYAAGGALLRHLTPHQVFLVAAALTAAGLAVVATTVREHSIRPAGRPGLRRTWATNRELFAHSGSRALLLNLWVPNGLVVGCEALFLSYAPEHAGSLLAAASAGMLLGDLVVGRLLTAARRRRAAFPLRLLLAVPYLVFAFHPPLPVALAAVFVSGAGFAATLPLQELLLASTPDAVRGQVQGVESAGRMTWQGLGAAVAGGVAGLLAPAAAITAVAAASVAFTVASRPLVARAARATDAGATEARPA